MKGTKTGGRQVGTPNKDRAQLFAEVEARHPGFNVLAAFLDMARDTKNETLRFNCMKEYAKYTLQQPKSVDISEAEDKNTIITIIREGASYPYPPVIRHTEVENQATK